jgi:hypoxanthine phosphoribosyltransferase
MQLSWHDVQHAVHRVAWQWMYDTRLTGVYGIPTGGCFVALLLAPLLELPLLDAPGPGALVVDDLIDSGNTLRQFEGKYAIDVLFRKPHSPDLDVPSARLVEGWIHFPWEHESAPVDAAVRLLQFIGRSPDEIKREAPLLVASLRNPTGSAALLAITRPR